MPLQSYCYLARPNQPSCLCNETIACHKQAEINVSCNLFESLKKQQLFLQVIDPISLAIATLSLMRNSNWLWNLKLFQVTCQLNYTWNSVINQVEFWQLCSFQVMETNQADPSIVHTQPLHTVSFDWFLSGLEWIINMEFC